MHGVRTLVGDIFIPIPAGWTVTEAPGAPATVEVTIEGSSPDRSKHAWRPPRKDITAKIIFVVDLNEGVIEHTARVSVRGKQQVRKYDQVQAKSVLTNDWIPFGSGGRRRADGVIKSLAEGGRTI